MADRKLGGVGGLLPVGSVVKGDEAPVLLDSSDDLVPSGFTTLLLDAVGGEEVDEMVGDGSTSDEVLSNCMWNGETLEDWDGMGDTISRVDNETGGSTIGVKRKDGLDGNVETLNLEGIEHDLGHLLSVGFWVLWSLSEEDLVLRWLDSELVDEAVFPNLLHLSPVGNNTGLDWVRELEDTSHLLGLITNVLGLRLDTNHLLVGSWLTNDGWELVGWLVVAGKTSLDHT